MNRAIRPGLLVLHGNRLELLGDAVFEWLGANPLAALEEEIFLIQSNGVAEWLKMSLAAHAGICAASRVELPARFLWRAYRQQLGRDAVPAQSALDKLPLTWRLMRLLPVLAEQDGFQPLAGFLQRGGLDRRLQLAQRLADLYDQYQVYRSDWLAAWQSGLDSLPVAGGAGPAVPLPAGQRWQAALWRELLAELDDGQRSATRPQLHRRFLSALDSGTAPASPLPRRVVLFGMTHVPMQTLQALAALSRSTQVLLAIPNPCRYHWADIIQGRELLRFERRRHPLRADRDLAAIGLEQMHAHAHPLLAAWGRQGRDFVRQLDVFDDVLQAQQRFALNRVDLFSEGAGHGLLQQVQANIRDLLPLAEHPRQPVDAGDRSIVFQIAHSAQREVEILHDQLLELLADSSTALRPRDIVVMVPDIAVFAPAIRSVFGQYPRGDARFIPFDIADLQQRGNNPLLVAIEWLLRLPQQRCRLSDLRDLFDVAAISNRFGVAADDLPKLALWMDGSGIRWGLDSRHRERLGLGACGEQNTVLFGLRRMLLGFASGNSAPAEAADQAAGFGHIDPYAEVGGLDATLAGSLAHLVSALLAWAELAIIDATPTVWADRVRSLLDDMCEPTDDGERLTLAALHEALRGWLEACDAAAFAEPVSLAVLREAWLSAVDEPGIGRRFRAGGVTFCTLLPMRSIPFEVVCLLGMNDGDYPRSSQRSDFDLMALPGVARPGDRSRRDDDRQLMLEALLSARRVLYLSWTGRSVRDNSVQAPSVLVSQLRDYLAAGWPGETLAQRTTEHPLQPFSRRYFSRQDGAMRLFTHAREWRLAHAAAADDQAPPGVSEPRSALVVGDRGQSLTIATLARFLRNPVKDFFRNRLAVVFAGRDDITPDDEVFSVGGLHEYKLLEQVIAEVTDVVQHKLADGGPLPDVDQLQVLLEPPIARLQRAGQLPMAELGQRSAQAIGQALLPMLAAWYEQRRHCPDEIDKVLLQFATDGVEIVDWLAGVRAADSDPAHGHWLQLLPSRLCRKGQRKARAGQNASEGLQIHRLIPIWIRTLLASANGRPLHGIIIGRDATVSTQPMTQAVARQTLAMLLRTWHAGMAAPLPLACETALALLDPKEQAAVVYEGAHAQRGEVEEACLARLFPDFEALSADGRFAELAEQVYRPLFEWTRQQVSFNVHPQGVDGDAVLSGNPDGGDS